MGEVVQARTLIAPSTSSAAAKINALAEVMKELPQIPFVTEHLLHAGMYTRTLRVPKEALIAAVLIRPATVLIGIGDMAIWSNDEVIRVKGYNVLPGSAGRKVAVLTYSEVCLSMILPCPAKTVQEAQEFFTPEYELLVPLSEVERHRILITGE